MINLREKEVRTDVTTSVVIGLNTYDLWDIDELLSLIKSSIPERIVHRDTEDEDNTGMEVPLLEVQRLHIELAVEDVGVRFSLSEGLRSHVRHLEKMKDPVFARYYSEACEALKERQEAEVVSD